MNIRVFLSCSITSIQSLFCLDGSFWNYLNVDYSEQTTRIQNTETVPSEVSELHICFFPQGSCDYDCKKGYILKHKLKQKGMHQIMLRFIIFAHCPINNTLHIIHHYIFFNSTESSPITFQSYSWGKRKKRKRNNL